jgi:uncharacterized protein (TIGR02246 family)
MTVHDTETEQAVRQTIAAFFERLNTHRITRIDEIATEDWVHIDPMGGWTRGRANVEDELRDVHSTFLKSVSDKPGEVVVRFATADVAVVTATSTLSTATLPNGMILDSPKQIRTFVVVHRDGQWRIMQDHNTFRRI